MRSGGHVLDLYVAGENPRAEAARKAIEELCELHLKGGYQLEVIDVLAEPGRAEEAHILATPTIVRRAPQPEVRVVGDLSDGRAVLAALDIHDGDRP